MRSRHLLTLACLLSLAVPLAAQSGGAVITRRGGTPDSVQVRGWNVLPTGIFTTSRAMIGVTISLAPGDHGRYGALIESVTAKGPAERAGIRAGDIITSVNGVTVLSPTYGNAAPSRPTVEDNLISTLSRLQPGKQASIGIRRDGKDQVIRVTPDVDPERTIVATQFESALRLDSTLAISRHLLDSMGSRLMGFTFDDARLRSRLDSSFVLALRDSTFRMRGGVLASDSARRNLMTALTRLHEAPERQEAMMSRRTFPSLELGGSLPIALLSTSVDALSRLELASLNAELGDYFGTREGVLVLAINAPGVLAVRDRVVPSEVRTRISSGTATVGSRAATETKAWEDAAAPDVLSLRAGDVITAVDGRQVTSPTQLLRILRSYRTGEELKLSVHRQQKAISVYTKMPE